MTLDGLRALNSVLAALTFFGLCYRLPQALNNVASKRLFVILALFPPVVGIGSLTAVVRHTPTGPIIPVLTCLYLALGWVCVRWPKQLDR